MSFQNPTLAELFRAWFAVDRRGLHTAIPGKVTRVDLAKGQVDVKPLVQGATENEEGDRVVAPLPIVVNVPIVFPGAGGFRLTFPVSLGDIGLLVFSESSLDVWLSSQPGADVDPLDDRRHDQTDGIFIPGLRPFTSPWNGIDAGAITVGSDGGAADFVALASKVATELNTLKTAISGAIVVPGDGGASFKSTLMAALAAWPGSVASGTLKVKG